jgi:hypothetical protein
MKLSETHHRADVHCTLHNLAASAKCKSRTAIFVFANKINRHQKIIRR